MRHTLRISVSREPAAEGIAADNHRSGRLRPGAGSQRSHGRRKRTLKGMERTGSGVDWRMRKSLPAGGTGRKACETMCIFTRMMKKAQSKQAILQKKTDMMRNRLNGAVGEQ